MDEARLVDSWASIFDRKVNSTIRKDLVYLKFINKYPYNTVKKKTLVDFATDEEWKKLTSGKFVEVKDDNPIISKMLREKFGQNTKTSQKYNTDPSNKEFDAITDEFFIEHKRLESSKIVPNKDKKAQMRFQAKACKMSGRKNYLIFDGVRNENWINKAIQIAEEFKVNTKIEVNGKLIHDLKF